jgi:hypothetical protein
MAFNGTPNLKGRATGSKNRASKQLKEVLSIVTDDLIESIDLSSLNDSDKIKLLIGLLPYLTAKQNYHEVVKTQNSTNWIDDYSEEDLQKLLSNV